MPKQDGWWDSWCFDYNEAILLKTKSYPRFWQWGWLNKFIQKCSQKVNMLIPILQYICQKVDWNIWWLIKTIECLKIIDNSNFKILRELWKNLGNLGNLGTQKKILGKSNWEISLEISGREISGNILMKYILYNKKIHDQ